ncbi:hypothetical protein KC19_8G031000 [Ceratodon purpureus]|uniref:J domain-containing protein n=1 Tax=Ceratodon purpureus TaxID=3225 RepID=A0A8T0GX02_CERPU|nr:hypothetical protein KC19_8G031000 [Ceratodon purpureus]
MANLCSGFTHCQSLGRIQSTSSRAAPGRHDCVVRASAGTSCRESAVSTAVDCRRVLGVGPNASKREVKAAYRKLALQFHPDVCRGEDQVDFMEVNRAYESLMALPSVGDESRTNNGYDAADYASPVQEDDDDPWADFLQSLVNGYREEPREDFSSYYSNLKYYSKAGRSKKYTGSSSQYYQGNW